MEVTSQKRLYFNFYPNRIFLASIGVELMSEESWQVSFRYRLGLKSYSEKKTRGVISPRRSRFNPLTAGALDFPPPAGEGGGGAFDAPWSRHLFVVEKNERRRSKAQEKSFRNNFGHYLAQVKIEVTTGQN